MNDSNSRNKILSGLVVVLAVAALIIWARSGARTPPEHVRGIYYTGPMRSKGDPNVFGYENGSQAPTPAGATTPSGGSKSGGSGGNIGD